MSCAYRYIAGRIPCHVMHIGRRQLVLGYGTPVLESVVRELFSGSACPHIRTLTYDSRSMRQIAFPSNQVSTQGLRL